MNVKKLYEQQMRQFFDLNIEIKSAVFIIFPPSGSATTEDLEQAKLLVEKTENIKTFLNDALYKKNQKVQQTGTLKSDHQ
jgi:hypothetical protein